MMMKMILLDMITYNSKLFKINHFDKIYNSIIYLNLLNYNDEIINIKIKK